MGDATRRGIELRLVCVTAGYGPADVLRGIDIEVAAGEAVAVLGPNGAGKSTITKVIMGVLPARTGTLLVNGTPIARNSARRAVRAGIALVPEGRRVFRSESVADNLRIGGWANRRLRTQVTADLEAVYERFPILRERRNTLAASLSGGEAQMLAVGMALMARPRLIILDEPSLGLAPMVVNTIMDEVARLRDVGVSVLLIEQDVRKALSVVDRAYILSLGRVHMTGTADEIRQNADFGAAYLGSTGVIDEGIDKS